MPWAIAHTMRFSLGVICFYLVLIIVVRSLRGGALAPRDYHKALSTRKVKGACVAARGHLPLTFRGCVLPICTALPINALPAHPPQEGRKAAERHKRSGTHANGSPAPFRRSGVERRGGRGFSAPKSSTFAASFPPTLAGWGRRPGEQPCASATLCFLAHFSARHTNRRRAKRHGANAPGAQLCPGARGQP